MYLMASDQYLSDALLGQAWVWTQAVAPVESGSMAVVMSWGPVIGSIEEHLLFFRDTAKGVAWDMVPDNSIVTRHEVDPCGGSVAFVVRSFSGRRRLEVNVTQPQDSAECLLGPMPDGFVQICAESFEAVMTVRAYDHDRLVRDIRLEKAALEFGGTILCQDPLINPCVKGGGGAVSHQIQEAHFIPPVTMQNM
jgi:hypothetical protein